MKKNDEKKYILVYEEKHAYNQNAVDINRNDNGYMNSYKIKKYRFNFEGRSGMFSKSYLSDIDHLTAQYKDNQSFFSKIKDINSQQYNIKENMLHKCFIGYMNNYNFMECLDLIYNDPKLIKIIEDMDPVTKEFGNEGKQVVREMMNSLLDIDNAGFFKYVDDNSYLYKQDKHQKIIADIKQIRMIKIRLHDCEKAGEDCDNLRHIDYRNDKLLQCKLSEYDTFRDFYITYCDYLKREELLRKQQEEKKAKEIQSIQNSLFNYFEMDSSNLYEENPYQKVKKWNK